MYDTDTEDQFEARGVMVAVVLLTMLTAFLSFQITA